MAGSFMTAGSNVMVVAPTGPPGEVYPAPSWVTSSDPAEPRCSGLRLLLLLLLLLMAFGTTILDEASTSCPTAT